MVLADEVADRSGAQAFFPWKIFWEVSLHRNIDTMGVIFKKIDTENEYLERENVQCRRVSLFNYLPKLVAVVDGSLGILLCSLAVESPVPTAPTPPRRLRIVSAT